ncbi:MAG: glutamate--tRNA ligase [Patescibacteria group bacterium]
MIRTRIAPSPTGKDVHVGSVATALMNFAWAKKHRGKFVVRIEDTDQTRVVVGGEQKMLETLESIGLMADESPIVGGPFAPYRQSERLDIYKRYAQELVANNKAYYCVCTPERLDSMRKKQQAEKQMPKYDRHCLTHQAEVLEKVKKGEKHVIRLLMPEKTISFHDIIRGDITIDTNNLDDQVLLKSDGFPTYHLGVVVDDHLMEITHIIRGEEWLPSTPKHIILFEAFGWKVPEIAHVSVLRNPDRSKLSKRKNPVWTSEYIHMGIFPEALLNYLALMGWSHPEGKDIFSLDEYIRIFDLKDIQKTAPVFDPVKLAWMNGMYIRKTPDAKLTGQIYEFYDKKYPEDMIGKTVPLIKERIKKLSDYFLLCEFFFRAPKMYEIDLSVKKEMFAEIAKDMEKIRDWTADTIGKQLAQTAEKSGLKNSEFFMLLRVAITGKKISPPLNESMEVLGKNECCMRLRRVTAP